MSPLALARPAPERLFENVSFERAAGGIALVLVALGPLFLDQFWISFVLTGVFLYGVAAASMIFLSAYGGMVSLAQVSLYGISAFALGNAVTQGESKGLNLGLHPWIGVILGISIATAMGFVLGAVASRSAGLYFLMITLTFAVLANYFFGQVTVVSGFGGVNNMSAHAPSLVGNPSLHPNRLYYVALIVALVVYALIRYVVRTPFGLVLQGIRDDPVRMSSLGYNVALHRTIAFGYAAFIASLAGVLFAWWNNNISPSTIDISGVLDLLVIAVVGGLYRLEGAWVGALVFMVAQVYIPDIGFLGSIGVNADQWRSIDGVIFLVIVILNPGGLFGIWDWGRGKLEKVRRPAVAEGVPEDGSPPAPGAGGPAVAANLHRKEGETPAKSP